MGMGHLYRFGAAWPRPAKGHREVYHGARVYETRWRNRLRLLASTRCESISVATTACNDSGEPLSVKISSAIRVALLALVSIVGTSLPSFADGGTVSLVIYKAGWVIGGSGGGGVLNFHGRSYSLSTGGLDYGFVFGGSKTVLHGTVSNIYRPSDVAGVYAAAGAGLAVGRGARAIVLTNQKGAVLNLSGHQVGLMANADLSGLAITLK